VDAILDAGIKRVFIGTRDPNPLVNGRGVRKLKRAGVEVVEGILEESCREINEAYNKFITDGMPLVTAKVALTFDGKLATADGSSRWITNQECRRYVHHLRSASDAVMVGAGTVRADDPCLDVRIPGFDGPGPKAVVVDEKLGIKRSAKLFEREEGDVIFATTRRAPLSKRGWIKEQGMDVITCRADSAGHVSLTNMLKELGRMGITSILLEGGGRLFAQFFKKGLVDRVVICMAPKLFGGRGKDFLPSLSIENMNDALSIHDISTKTFGDNIVIEGRLK